MSIITKKDKFMGEYIAVTKPSHLVVGVKLPNGIVELIINQSSENIREKIIYYMTAYDDDLRLKTNPNVEIIKYMII